MRKQQRPEPRIEFVCPKCGYKPPPNQTLSNRNWEVFDNNPCPHCNIPLTIALNDMKDEEN